MRGELQSPDPEHEGAFDPCRHDGGAAIELGIGVLENEANFRNEKAGEWSPRRASTIALGAYDYLVNTIGFDIRGAFQRWRKIPVTFRPAHVSNRYGASDKGSLSHLLEDAVRAYTFGSFAATIAMCRATLEMALKQHYLPDQEGNSDLSNLIVLADKRYDFVQAGKIDPIRKKAYAILHRYHKVDHLSDEDEHTILNYLKTVKFLIERAPKR